MTDKPIKRAIDVAVSATGLVLAAPLIGLLGIAVRLDSPGPAFFRHGRTGKHGATIYPVKLRTMVANANRIGPAVTATHDVRITRVGRWLRRTKLDELPQLWNVLRGDMSLVGPRPEVPQYTAMYRPEWLPLLSVRPGITDLASLTFRDEEALLAAARDRERAYREVVMPMKLQLALEGVEKSSAAYDAEILLRTAVALFRIPSARGRAVLEEAKRRIELLNEEV